MRESMPRRALALALLVATALTLLAAARRPTAHADTSPADALLAAGEQHQVIQFNPNAALQKRIFADGFVPNSPEFSVIINGAGYSGQRAENLGSGQVRVYYVMGNDYGNILSVTRGAGSGGSVPNTLLAEGEGRQVIQFNPNAALQKRIFADGFVPNSPEFNLTVEGVAYAAQRAENLGSGQVRVYYVANGDYGNVPFVTRGGDVSAPSAPPTGLVDTTLSVPPGINMPARAMRAPQGVSVSVVAAGLRQPRFMTFDTAGNLLVADQTGSVYRYPTANGALQPTAAAPAPILSGLNTPSSLALYQAADGVYLYVGETDRISRYRYTPDGLPSGRETVVSLPSGAGHFTRTVVFGPDGKMYVSVGSSCNICQEQDERRAAILRYNPDGSGYERFAWGLRNAVGLAFQPGTGGLWATVNERDNQGNDIPPDLVTIVGQGQDFGWPRCLPPNATPQTPGADCSNVTPPTVAIGAHAAPLGLAFYTGSQFPTPYQGNALVAQHGSWNRQPPAEPKLLRIRFEGGQAVGAEDFVTGWQFPNGQRWGRVAGVIVAPDGSLIVSDDQAGVLYRVAYSG